jgi:Holliday junction resolvase RusA-like endonuclease
MQIKFFIPKKVISLNVLLTMHWAQRSKEKSAWGDYIFEAWMKHKRFVFVNPVKVFYLISEPVKRIRDKDNYIGGAKAVITDFLKKTFFTRDDAEWLKNIDAGFIKGPTGVHVMIEEMPR